MNALLSGEFCSRPGYTPLHMAVGYSHMPVAAALLEAGADPEVWPLDVRRHGIRCRTASVLLMLLCERKFWVFWSVEHVGLRGMIASALLVVPGEQVLDPSVLGTGLCQVQ